MSDTRGDAFDPHVLADRYEQGLITGGEMLSELLTYCRNHSAESAEVLDALSRHSIEAVRDFAAEARDLLRKAEEQIQDIGQIRRSSPLQPGARILLGGGYEGSNSWWLDGRESYGARFIDFVECGVEKMPAAFVELDVYIDMTEASGLRHSGRYALLRLRFVGDWEESEVVYVHVVDALPADTTAFYASHHFGTEIESHATYQILAP